ncbi:hypothetical protein [Vibrio sp. SCSIO 43137]|uniref:hypothetical protein n=1 Tax=Vibrio sp. SCSIO 43137 TaxID=3021011 RepID=UPI0023077B28|nr:hypothetical protein [Vibrio sp. SCSIO 43137]WCE31903.1 hypothetical protein PK654_22525 [Vibrio sp. SCSIO 43137]
MQPCPFCHSTNQSVEIKPSAWDAKTEEPHIICNDCAASAPVYIWQRLGSEEAENEVKPERCSGY